MAPIIYKVSNDDFPDIVYIGMSSKGIPGAKNSIKQLKIRIDNENYNPPYKSILTNDNYKIDILEIIYNNDNIIDRKHYWENQYYKTVKTVEATPVQLEEAPVQPEQPKLKQDISEIIKNLEKSIALERYEMSVCQAKIQMYSARLVFIKETGQEPYEK